MTTATAKFVDPKAADKFEALRIKCQELRQFARDAMEAYRLTDDGMHARLARVAIAHLFPAFVSWKGVCRLLNAKGAGREYRTLFSLYVSLGIPMHRWIESDWDHRNTQRVFTVTQAGKTADEKLHDCEYGRVPG